MKKLLKIFGRTILIFIAIILLLFIAVQTSFVQNWLVGFATKKISKDLGTEVKIKHVSIAFFNKLNLEGTLIRDKQKDTLLYAGALKVRITDWFFLKDKADLKYIGLEDAIIKLNRKDSVWNYQFIVNYFSSSDTSSNKKSIALDLKKIDLKNVLFVQNDLWEGQKITANVNSFLVDAENIDFANKRFIINTLSLDNPTINFDYFTKLNKQKQPLQIKENKKDTGLHFNPGMFLTINSVKLNNIHFTSWDSTTIVSKYFDAEHLQIQKLTGTINNVKLNKDTLKANLSIACKERCGFELKKLKANLKITPEIIELAKLDLQTNRSRITDYYAMKFKHFNKDFGDYMSKVFMDARFKNTIVNSNDIAFFAPDLKAWNKQINVAGNYLGTVANFTINNFFINAGGTTNVAGNLTMRGLPDIDNTLIDFTNGTIKTDRKDLVTIIPTLKKVTSPNLSALGQILFRGVFKGTINKFITDGVISSAIGAIDANVAMQFPKKGEPSYKGNLFTNRFNLGKFINTTSIGLVDFNGTLDGSSFNLDRLKAKIDGDFNSIEFNGYNYTNINTNGILANKKFNGELKIDDPNLDFTSSIELDLSKEKPSINILGDLVKSNFKKLQLTKENVELSGLFDLNFTGKNIDDFTGTAKILNANLVNENDKLSFDSLVLTSQFNEGNKILTLASNEFTASITGKSYKLLELPTVFQNYLNHYYPTYFAAPIEMPKNQDFTVSIFTKEFDKYARILDKKLGGLDYASIVGKVNTTINSFQIQANIPTFIYDNIHVSDATIIGDGSLDTLKINGDITNIKVGDSLNFPNTSLSIISSNDYSDVSIQAKAENTLNEALLHAELHTLEDGVRIKFKPSSFVLNDKKWNLEKEGEIVVRKHFVSAENVKFTQGFQEIKVETELAEEGTNANNLIVKLKNVVLGDLTSLAFKNPQLEGLATGEIRLNDFYGDFNATAKLSTEQFRLNADSIGLVSLNADYNSKKGIISFKAVSPNEGYNFKSNGYYNLKDSSNSALYVNTELSNSTIDAVQQFIGDIFSDLKGKATGNLIVKGNPSSPELSGKIVLKNAGLKVNYSQVYYTIDSANVSFDEDGIDFGKFTIQDKFKNTGTVQGKLYEKGFKNMAFDFDLYTNKLLLIDTKARDNKQFYGKAIGKANLSFKGPEYAAKMSIVGEANDTSHIYIPINASKESGEADFIVFKKYGKEMLSENKKSDFDLTVDLDLTANNKVSIDVILDELTGDVLKANGNGRLRIVAGTNAPLTMKGRYNIERGSYDFNFQAFIRKPFEMLPEAENYIEWTGDPLKAEVKIDAQYVAERVTVSDLLASQRATVSSATASYRGQVFVIASLRNKLTKPDISFRLDFPQSSPIKTDAVFTEFINRIEKDQNEMLSQATSLIVFGSFAPYGQGVFSGGSNSGTSLNTFGVNTISQMLTKQVNKGISNLLFKLTGDKSIKFDLGTSFYSSSSILDQSSGVSASNNNRLDRTNVNFKLGKSFLNEKIVLTVGSEFDFGVGSSSIANGNFQWLPDVNAEFILTPDRRLRAIVFSKNSLDISGSAFGRRNRQGLSLSYKRDFDKVFARKEDTKPIVFKTPVP